MNLKKNKINYKLKDNDNSISYNIYNIIITQKKNNFIISLTDNKGNVLFNESPGTIGYTKAARKNFYTYQEVLKVLFYKIDNSSNYKHFNLIFKGLCKGKQSIINTLINLNVNLVSISSEVFYAKNGCRPKKQRRL